VVSPIQMIICNKKRLMVFEMFSESRTTSIRKAEARGQFGTYRKGKVRS
jgi:hypothetical protein